MGYKPEGYTSAAPYLMVRDARHTIDFLKAVFNAEELRSAASASGGVMHAEMRIDDTVIMMGEAGDGEPAHVHVYVADVDAAFAWALEAGGKSVQEPMSKGDGDRRSGVADPNGIVWWIATQEDVS